MTSTHPGRPPDDLASAVFRVELPITVVDVETGRVLGISAPALELLGMTAPEVIGRRVADVAAASEREPIELALEAVRRGRVGFLVGEATVQRAGGDGRRLLHWTHAFDIGDRRVALVQTGATGPAGMSPIGRRVGRESVRMAVGVLDDDGVVTAVSTDVRDLFGIEPSELVGHELVDEVVTRDLRPAARPEGAPGSYSLALAVELPVAARRAIVVLPALAGAPPRPFVLLDEPPPPAAASARVAELEYWLGQVGAIALASGVLQRIGPAVDLAGHPEASTLSRRQWEVLNRLARGESVREMADAMFVSPSTVRNHLSSIYAHFGVHSREELLAHIRAPAERSSRETDALSIPRRR